VALGTTIRTWRPLHGGCIAQAFLAESATDQFFVKHCPAGAPEMFAAEAAGLRTLANSATLRIPAVLAVSEAFLVLEYVEPGTPGPAFMPDFGAQFAALHRASAAKFGFTGDTFLGTTRQHNAESASWPEFFYEHRLVAQLQLAEQNHLATPELRHAIRSLEARIAQLLATDEPPALLHGDLWSGNFLVAHDGAPCIFDPAVYYGSREADLAMTYLFGGFDSAFYDAYQEAWPLPDGHARRRRLYEAYHMLNHLNLFGSSYYSAALSRLTA